MYYNFMVTAASSMCFYQIYDVHEYNNIRYTHIRAMFLQYISIYIYIQYIVVPD